MGTFFKILLPLAVAAAGVFIVTRIIDEVSMPILQPSGAIALQQRDLLITATLLMMVVIIPVFVMTFFFAWRYRADNKHATYTPDWDHNKTAEAVWWGVPCVIIGILAVLTWQTSHSLDPYRPLATDGEHLTIQVVALPWKWLFIYPEERIATVNYVHFPVDKPVRFEITADAPMNSFWIPQLGGQVYAMAGMTTKLHLIANEPGEYAGSSANLSGKGFAGMNFTAKASSESEYLAWLEQVRQSTYALDQSTYNELARPSSNDPITYYRMDDRGPFSHIVMKFMTPEQQLSEGFDPIHIRHNLEPPADFSRPAQSHGHY
jgi:cytochrome o ubiquinol oxidase subunit II